MRWAAARARAWVRGVGTALQSDAKMPGGILQQPPVVHHDGGAEPPVVHRDGGAEPPVVHHDGGEDASPVAGGDVSAPQQEQLSRQLTSLERRAESE